MRSGGGVKPARGRRFRFGGMAVQTHADVHTWAGINACAYTDIIHRGRYEYTSFSSESNFRKEYSISSMDT